MFKRYSQDKMSIYPNAGSHNSIFRGKNLGTSVTLEQYASIANGTFDDLFVGDYWNIEGVNWRIAGFDYFLKTGDTELTKHHVVIVPDTSLYNAKMNNTNTTNGGYVGSDMYKIGLNKAKEQIKRIFVGHVVNHRERLCNTTSGGNPRGSIWVDSEVELLCETMLYGAKLFSPLPNGVTIIDNYNVGNAQLPLFALDHSYVCNRQNLWLRDIVANECFAFANDFGDCYYDYSSAIQGVRPYFLIG